MSYCRWSSDNFKCDLYCYEDVSGGFTTCIAGNRIKGNIPILPKLTSETVKDGSYLTAYKEQMAFLETAEREKIDLPHANETFNDPDLESFLERLIHLREIGYNFPDYVIESVKESRCWNTRIFSNE